VERITRLWTRLQPRSWTAWRAHAIALSRLERFDEARRALARADAAAPTDQLGLFYYSHVFLWENRPGEVLRQLEPETRRGEPSHRSEARWWRVYAFRTQGKFQMALDETREFRRLEPANAPLGSGTSRLLEGLSLFEAGQFREAALVWDSAAQVRHPLQDPPSLARNETWGHTQEAAARAAMGDTVRLKQLVDLVRESGAKSALLRDNKLYRHIEGLLWLARHRPAEAEAAFRDAIYAISMGYTRTNLELGRLLVSQGRGEEAVEVLQPALRGGLDGSPLYTNRTELRGLLGEAWLAARNTDSARHHLTVAAATWADGDLRARAESARWRGLAAGIR
jgi:tetratricopeptide (TPR) repeat protein